MFLSSLICFQPITDKHKVKTPRGAYKSFKRGLHGFLRRRELKKERGTHFSMVVLHFAWRNEYWLAINCRSLRSRTKQILYTNDGKLSLIEGQRILSWTDPVRYFVVGCTQASDKNFKSDCFDSSHKASFTSWLFAVCWVNYCCYWC